MSFNDFCSWDFLLRAISYHQLDETWMCHDVLYPYKSMERSSNKVNERWRLPCLRRLIIDRSSPEIVKLDHDNEQWYHRMDSHEDDRFLVLYPNLEKNECNSVVCWSRYFLLPVHFLNWLIVNWTISWSALCNERLWRTSRKASAIIEMN